MSITHRHVWGMDVPNTCKSCGLTRGRASRLDGDLATISRFLGGAGAEALQSMDPVQYSITITVLRAAAREAHAKHIQEAVDAKMAADHAAMKALVASAVKSAKKSAKLTITPKKSTPKKIPGTTLKVSGPSLSTDGSLSVTFAVDET